VIQREISRPGSSASPLLACWGGRVLVLNLSGKTRCSGTAEEIFAHDSAFALIAGRPQFVEMERRANLPANLHAWGLNLHFTSLRRFGERP